MNTVSYIDENHLKDLENLVFFNEHQLLYLKEISQVIKDYGIPKLHKTTNGFTIVIQGLSEIQALFFFDDNNEHLIGFALLYRENIDTFTLIHIAISNEYTSLHSTKNIYLFKILNEILKIIKQIKNVCFLKILYSDRIKYLRVKR